MIKALSPSPWEDPSILVIYPKTFEVTGRIKDITAKSRKTKEISQWAIPTDQYLRVSKNKYIFILALDYFKLDVVREKVSSLEGGLYEALDLRRATLSPDNPDYNLYPYTADMSRLSEEVNKYTAETQIVDSLRTKEGVSKWGNFTKGEVYKYFLCEIEDRKVCLLFSRARAWGLQIYLDGYFESSKMKGLEHQLYALQKFAIWMYHCSNTWADYSHRGLYLYTPTTKTSPYYLFKPSDKAKLEYMSYDQYKVAKRNPRLA